VPLNPFTQSSNQDTTYVHEKLKNSKDVNNINSDKNGEDKEKMNCVEKEENEYAMRKGKENDQLNPFHYLSLLFKYVFGKSDINTKFKTFPKIKIAGTMDLIDTRLGEQGRTNKENFQSILALFKVCLF
jgi:hypothetical protein